MAITIRLVNPAVQVKAFHDANPDQPVPVLPRPHRVAPLRFARAWSDFTNAAAPDLDDRGFTLCDGGGAHGPTLGIPDRVNGAAFGFHVKVVRDRIGPDAALFPVVEKPDLVRLVVPTIGVKLDPVAGGTDPAEPGDAALGPDVIKLRAARPVQVTATSDFEDSRLWLRYGSVNGPVVAEMMVRVYQLLEVPLKLHRVRIRGEEPETDVATVDTALIHVNAIHLQAGLVFIVERPFTPVRFDDPPAPGTLRQAVDSDMQGLAARQYDHQKLNLYMVRRFDRASSGIGFPKVNNFGLPPVAFVADDHFHDASIHGLELGWFFAHEIGHVLGLDHFGDSGNGHPADHLWARRDLMYSPPIPKREDPEMGRVGYGQRKLFAGNFINRLGALSSTKKRPGILQGDQIAIMRRVVQRREYTG